MKNKIPVLLLFLIPYLLTFKSVFLGGELSFGDAPYFYPENLEELFNPPFIWDVRYINFGGIQSGTLWLYLPTFLFGLLNHFFGLSSEILIRIVFVIPSTILGFTGMWKLSGLFLKNTYTKFLCAFIYIFNTYYILLIDGGQIGVALAFGLFPWVVFVLLNFQKEATIKNFSFSLALFFLLTNIDVREAFILTFLLIIFFILKIQNVKRSQSFIRLGLILFAALLLDLFWVYPLIRNFNSLEFSQVSSTDINFVSILNSLLLYQPHFPINDFGKVILPPFYFAFLPILLLSGLIFTKRNEGFFLKLTATFLFFVFLAKGKSAPFGEVYGLIDYIPVLGVMFRDSSKFFIPLLLVAGILLGLSFETVLSKVRIKNSFFLFTTLYIFLITLISPAVFGQLSGGLNNPVSKEDFLKVHKNLSLETKFFRTLWFDERPPLGYSSWDKPAISANTLYLKRPFADMIEGSYDLNGFLNSPLLKDWLNVAGVKYIFFPENERKKILTPKQKKERRIFLDYVSSLGFKKVDWRASFSVYEVEGSLPHIFAVDKVFLISGGDQIYLLFKENGISIKKKPAIFIDDTRLNANLMEQLSRKNTQLLIQGDENDLIFSFLKEKMLDLSNFKNQWAKRETYDYLRLKGELLEKGIRNFDYDFGKGVSFSTIKNEKIKISQIYNHSVDNILAIRYISATESAGIRFKINSKEKILKSKTSTRFEWAVFELMEDEFNLEIENLGGTSAVNTIIITPKQEFEGVRKKVEDLLSSNDVIHINEDTDYSPLSLSKSITTIEYNPVNPTSYEVKIPVDQNWIIFTDSFDKGWILENSNCKIEPVPIYSFINGFHIDSACKDNLGIWRLHHKSQEDIKVGIFLSLAFFTTLILVLVKVAHQNGFLRKNN